jgi:hypothetical protein
VLNYTVTVNPNYTVTVNPLQRYLMLPSSKKCSSSTIELCAFDLWMNSEDEKKVELKKTGTGVQDFKNELFLFLIPPFPKLFWL